MKRGIFTRTLLYGLLYCFVAVIGCEIHMSGYSYPRARYERTVQLSRPISGGTLFSAKSNDGRINVTGGDVAECSVTATIIARADSDEKAGRIAEEAKVKLEKFGSKLTVKLEKPVLWTNESVDIQIEAMVPKNCNVELVTDDGNITTENINGNIEVKTDDGEVNLSRIVGNIKVRSNDGSTRVEDFTGDVNIQGDDGRITVIYSEDADGVYNVSMVTNDGAIDFTAPANFSANVEVITDDGSIDTGLPIKVVGKLGKNGIKGTIGTGEGRLYIKTDDGSVRIR